ncbi:3'-5' exonuclease family protein [Allosalinactinospora lopnorensis]|uniref:hypothetical protein n=1 Tax=Allosalinactinospora lopnorensis TaxID=1352348 RepID=UPI00138F72E8|nr:hypothetical protein [Allosalinactinospora lopnorensis]
MGHNVGVDRCLLHRHYPDIGVHGLIDTLKLAKRGTTTTWSLTTLIEHHALTDRVTELVPDGRPHRALWDTVAAVLLAALVEEHWSRPPSLADLLTAAGQQIDGHQETPGGGQQSLL